MHRKTKKNKQKMKAKEQKFKMNLLDGGSVAASVELHNFDYIGGDCICNFVDADGDRITVKRSEGDLWIESTGDWIQWDNEEL